MTGPEAYKESLRLIDSAHEFMIEGDPAANARCLAEAQVFATLALAAAHLAGVLMHPADRAEWDRATGRPEATT